MYNIEYHEKTVAFGDVPEHLDRIIGAFDEPFSGVISTYFVTQLIGAHVKVVLSEDGADEVFGSYLPHRLAQPLAQLEGRLDDLAGIRQTRPECQRNPT